MDKRVEEIRRLSRKGPLDINNPSIRVAVEKEKKVPAVAGEDSPATGDRAHCPICDEEISARAKKCRHCGEALDPELREIEARRRMGGRPYTRNKNKVAAGIFAILLGWFGLHKYYLGRIGQGLLYTLFFWTGIPALLGLIEGIVYLTMDEERFWEKYG